MYVGRWIDAREVNLVESVVGVACARQCGVRANETYIFGGEDCRETVVAKLSDGDHIAVS